MFKTTELSEILALKAFRADNNEIVRSGNCRADETFKNSFKSTKLKNNKSEILTNIGTTGKPIFLIPGSMEAFNQLRQAFTKTPILLHFDFKCHIQIEIDTSGYAIGKVLSELTSNQLTTKRLADQLILG